MSQATIVVEGTFREGYEKHFEEYSRTMRAFLARHQATVIRRQRVKKTLYGTHRPDLIMVIDFPTEELAETLFFQQEYLDILPCGTGSLRISECTWRRLERSETPEK